METKSPVRDETTNVVNSLSDKGRMCRQKWAGKWPLVGKGRRRRQHRRLRHEGAARCSAAAGQNSDAPTAKLGFAHGPPAPSGPAAVADRHYSLVGPVPTSARRRRPRPSKMHKARVPRPPAIYFGEAARRNIQRNASRERRPETFRRNISTIRLQCIAMPIMHISVAGRVLKHHALGITVAVMQHC